MRRNRPLIITVLCLIGFAGGLAAIPMALSQQAETIGRLYPLFLLLSAAGGLVWFAGLWILKRWSVVAYTILAGVSQASLIAIGSWSIAALIIPGIVIAIGFSYYNLMES